MLSRDVIKWDVGLWDIFFSFYLFCNDTVKSVCSGSLDITILFLSEDWIKLKLVEYWSGITLLCFDIIFYCAMDNPDIRYTCEFKTLWFITMWWKQKYWNKSLKSLKSNTSMKTRVWMFHLVKVLWNSGPLS